ncbi:MAG: alpha/beta fold hydrolase [Burkholderiales bacterium]|nr:alpha/beta fold hydrolase [Burkholderiales bacterium]
MSSAHRSGVTQGPHHRPSPRRPREAAGLLRGALARPWRVIGAGLLAAALLAGCATLDQRQREWIFRPGDRAWPGGLAAARTMQDVWIDYEARGREPVRLHALWAAPPSPGAPVLLYLHGAGYDLRGSAHRMQRWQSLGFGVLGVDYRGFGRSSDALPSEASALEDALAAWDWLRREHGVQRRFVFGHSLGGAIAVALASEVDDEAGLIVEGAFTSIPEVVATFRWGWLPVGPLITQRFDAGARIASVGSPVLVLHGGADRLIRPELGRRLYERAAPPKRFVLVEGASHHSASAVGRDALRAALDELWGLRAAE